MSSISNIESINDMLTIKIEEINKTKLKIEKLLETCYSHLSEEDKENLPKFGGRLTKKNIDDYFNKLSQSIKNPIRYKRKNKLKNLGIRISNIRDDFFDDNKIDETINLLNEIKKYERLFNIISNKLPFKFLDDENNIESINLWLGDIVENIDNLERWEEKIKSKELLDKLLEKYVDRNISIEEFKEIAENIQRIEKKFGIKIKKDEINLINKINEILDEVEEYGVDTENLDCSSLSELKEELDNFKKQLENKCNEIKEEIKFWKQVLYGKIEYLPEKNLDELNNKLNDIKEETKTEFGDVYLVLENLYRNQYFIPNIYEFSCKLKTVAKYFDNINIENENDVDKIENVYNAIKYLEKINHKISKMNFKEVDEFLSKYENIKSEYENMRKDILYYQKILNREDETIPENYYELKQKLENYKKELQTKIGNDFEVIIKFLKGELDDFDANKETLKNFIIYLKPLVKEVLNL
ncbi:hypothetical protein [Methanotorris formicicus]|uniref:Uncharacterized protein n=1 Tax=Methanotorris formicicus Mc-S-70 TaxID=647171 RepID=H1KWF7_9EURY|nr:hypothetical protein [Methanotorris formicicus]EHP89534.1 hypothetical protein MetfoDRAFT_0130 [Methanotorris formicicus Mc-S-70]